MRMWIVSVLRDRSLGLLAGRDPEDIERILQTNIAEDMGIGPDIGEEGYEEWRETGLLLLELTEDESNYAYWFMFELLDILITALLRQGVKHGSFLTPQPAVTFVDTTYEGTPDILHQI